MIAGHTRQVTYRAIEEQSYGGCSAVLAVEICGRQALGIRNNCILYRIRIVLRGTLLSYCDTSIVTL